MVHCRIELSATYGNISKISERFGFTVMVLSNSKVLSGCEEVLACFFVVGLFIFDETQTQPAFSSETMVVVFVLLLGRFFRLRIGLEKLSQRGELLP